MARLGWTRRQMARCLLLGALPQPGRTVAVENRALRIELTPRPDGRFARSFTNKWTGETLELPPVDFELEFDNALVVRPSHAPSSLNASADCIRLLYPSPQGVEVEVEYSLRPDQHYLRKQIRVRCPNRTALRLLRADLENWQGVRRNWRCVQADRLPYGSHPIYCESLWAGVEFVAAFNRYSEEGFLLRSRPGGLLVGREWTALHPVVIGVAETGRVREAFLRYIEDIRLAPPRLVACYNSWWTLPLRIRQTEVTTLARELVQRLHARHGVFFDIFTVDEGWADPQSIWEIDRRSLPQGFAELRSVVESAGGRLGLWISPSGVYPRSLDHRWAEQQGLRVLWAKPGHWHRTGVSLADPVYRQRTQGQLRRLIREERLAHVKFDGFIAREDSPHHDLLPGEDSVEPLARYALELIQVCKEANPDFVSEPTFLNSLANYISPWILKYADCVWANAGGDCPRGLGPAPDYREAHTTAREYYIFSSLDEVWLPQNALQYFDIVHCDPDGSFPNHAAMAFGRGRFFLATYLNPLFMTEEDWRIYAGLLRWARANQGLLRHTQVLRSRVERGEPYAYAHWQGSRGLIVVRNPSNESKTYTLELAATGAPGDLRDAVCWTQFPYRRGLAAGLDARSQLVCELGPWELLYLEIARRAELREPAVIGGRWYPDASGTRVAPDWDAEQLHCLHPGGGETVVRIQPRARPRLSGAVRSVTASALPEPSWFTRKGERLPTIAFAVEAVVAVPAEASHAELLLLVESAGREPKPSHCRATRNGRPVPLRRSSSEGHIGYHASRIDGYGKEAIPYESEWTWHICDLAPGESEVRFTGAAADPDCRVGLWLWVDCDAAARSLPVAFPCSAPALPPYQEHRERFGICLRERRPLKG